VVSICSVTDCAAETLPTLSVASQRTVAALESWKVALAALTVVAVPLVAGSVPSVVYVMLATSEPPSLASSSMSIGALFVQPDGQALPLQLIVLLGAVPSA
jgi:hypothetical protein